MIRAMDGMEKVKCVGHAIWVAVRLAFFGWGGFFIMLYGSIDLATSVDSIIHPDDPSSPTAFFSLPTMICGALLMLYGSGQWKRWRYLWVFFSMPISLLVLLLVSIPFPEFADEEMSVLFFGLAAFVANTVVKKHYARTFCPSEEDDSGPIASAF